MEKEIFEGRYIIYSDGRIWSVKRNKFLKIQYNPDGYGLVTITQNNSKQISKSIHRLVAESFIPNPDNLPQVNHKNLNKADNRVENLEWCTYRQNVNHRYKSKYPGSTFNKQIKKWQSLIYHNGKQKSLGYFNNPEEASNAYIFYCTIHNLY
jgi:hypothetical protein